MGKRGRGAFPVRMMDGCAAGTGGTGGEAGVAAAVRNVIVKMFAPAD